MSCSNIAGELNGRGVPSPGLVLEPGHAPLRRLDGLGGARDRAEPIYRGEVLWNTSQWVKDPDSAARKRIARPESEWIRSHDERLRIVSDELWRRAQRTTRMGGDKRLKSGGKPRYVLSGILKCPACDANLTLDNGTHYSCGTRRDGRGCDNDVRVPRMLAQELVVGRWTADFLSPANQAAAAKLIQQRVAAELERRTRKAEAQPVELAALDARIARLRGRLRDGDPD